MDTFQQSSNTRTGAVKESRERKVRLRVEGTVQGVGFRPFVYRLACRYGLSGWVLNDERGVLIGVSGLSRTIARFESALRTEAPPAARVEHIGPAETGEDPPGYSGGEGFVILGSRSRARIEAAIPPDLAVCSDCLREMRDPEDRRYQYPFINCTNCGPRYSIIERIPYDRPGTTMRGFRMCPACRAEYENPADRRFHAQPVACPDCGPQLSYWDSRGKPVAGRHVALLYAVARLRAGGIVAVKGIGGFHLMCDAGNDTAVKTLRERKNRPEKPFALMAPYLAAARRLCGLSPEEEALLASARAPIVLARRLPVCCGDVSPFVAPDNPLVGVMLPYAPLHHLIMETWQGFLVATSGNLSDEPICVDENEALSRLHGIADVFLVHNRPISRAVDDSIVRWMNGGPVVLRRARGYAPEPVSAPSGLPPLLAAGAYLKNSVAVTAGGRLFPSQHLGDLSTQAARGAFADAVAMLSQLYQARPEAVACDLHPDYPSSIWAEGRGIPVVRVQHHHAHVLSCMAEHGLGGSALGVSWDGTGYGPDGTVWGGEWLVAGLRTPGFRRHASLRAFPLPGGEAAIRRPAATALGLLWELYMDEMFRRDEARSILGFAEKELRVFERLISRRINTPETTSAGRLFDGVAALLGLGGSVSFEAQAAMKLEFLAGESGDSGHYDFHLIPSVRNDVEDPAPAFVVDWAPMLLQLLEERAEGRDRAAIARRFHNTLAEMMVEVARTIPGLPLVLTGGCFQNKLLLECAFDRLKASGREVYGHRDIPPNDGGISIGQIVGAAAMLNPSPF